MTIDDVDSGEHNAEYEESIDGKHSRRDRLKDALNRTRTKISKVKEERGAKKQKQEQEKINPNVDEDVNDFLSAGRPPFAASQRPSFGSDFRPSIETSPVSPRPSTSESQIHPSPRRVLPISIPRIDVSASSRFPNAKDVQADAWVPRPGYSALSSGSAPSSSLLKPAYKARNQSANSIASADRKARIRGLSVSFVDMAPVIIGEGGEEAEAPPMEISRAKARARSASPQGRRPYMDTTVKPEARRQMPTRGISDNSADAFVPKPFTRVQTGASLESIDSRLPRGRNDHDFIPKPFTRSQTEASLNGYAAKPVPSKPEADDFVPKPFARANTVASPDVTDSRSASRDSQDNEFVPKPFARTQTGFSDSGSSQSALRAPPMPLQTNAQAFMPLQLAGVQTGSTDLAKEFEMTLGLNSPIDSSPAINHAPESKAQIWAPKPKRAAPSYELIEDGGKRHEFNNGSASPPPNHHQQNQQIQQPPQRQQEYEVGQIIQRQDPENARRRPVAQTQSFATQQFQLPEKQAPPEGQQQPQRSPEPSMQPTQQRPPQNSTQRPPPRSPQTQALPVPQRSPFLDAQPSQGPPLPASHPSTQAYYPPPPQRTATQTARIPQQLERISPKPSRPAYSNHQETGVVRDNISLPTTNTNDRTELTVDTNNDAHRSFADRQKTHSRDNSFGTPTSARTSPHTTTIRQIMPSNTYISSPSNYSGSIQNTPQTAQGEPTPTRLRFYESMNQGHVPEGFL